MDQEIVSKTTSFHQQQMILDLICIHRERITSLMRLNKWVDHNTIQRMVAQLIQESRTNLLELRSWLSPLLLSEPADRKEGKGELYASWPGIPKLSPGCQWQELIRFFEEDEKTFSLMYMKLLCRRGIFSRELRKIFSRHLARSQKRTASLRVCFSCPETDGVANPEHSTRLAI
ncbi:MAG: hypothetical protein SFU20_04070 [Chitinophagaceae bacterium]|nr:hypothetical protein [Chitinophagaceae bacterium]